MQVAADPAANPASDSFGIAPYTFNRFGYFPLYTGAYPLGF